VFHLRNSLARVKDIVVTPMLVKRSVVAIVIFVAAIIIVGLVQVVALLHNPFSRLGSARHFVFLFFSRALHMEAN
jgi:hypothetical protein